MILDVIKKRHPEVPTIMYINKSGALLERMAATGVDIISVDWTVDLDTARKRLPADIGLQGNLDPAVLLGNHDTIKERTEDVLRQAKGARHIMNLGHGIDATTPEENADFFVKTVQNWKR